MKIQWQTLEYDKKTNMRGSSVSSVKKDPLFYFKSN
jgi:hypothetical protein